MQNKIKQAPKYKQMAFETAVRNPERYKDILKELLEFEGKILDDKTLLQITTKLYKKRIVTAKEISIHDLESDILKEKVISVNESRKADGGFPAGYASRFWTYVRTLSELGFIFARYNKKMLFSDMAKMLSDENTENQISEQTAFMIQASLFNRKSPYRNVKNDFNYFKFISKFLIKRWNENKGGLSYEQFILSTFSQDGNIADFEKIIASKKFLSQERLYDFLKSDFGVTTKFKTVCRDYPDVVLRMLKITGFISLKLNTGKLVIKINEEKINEISEIFEHDFTFTDVEKNDEAKFFEKYSEYSRRILNSVARTQETKIESNIDESQKLQRVISTYKISVEDLVKLIENLDKSRFEERFETFKYIPAPTRLEFYISLLLQSVYGDKFEIKPNYKSDSEGLPISHAPGNTGDIEVKSKDLYWLVEVTLMQNRTQQLNFETTSVIRHLKTNDSKTKYLSLIAPYIHEDTKTFYDNEIIRHLGNENDVVYIKPFGIGDFVKAIINKQVLEVIKKYTDEYIEEKERQIIERIKKSKQA